MLDIISMITFFFIFIGLPMILVIIGGNDKTEEEQKLEDKEQMEGYICDCGKESIVPKQSPYCPKCGRHLTERNHQAYIDGLKKNSVCFGIVILAAISLSIFCLFITILYY